MKTRITLLTAAITATCGSYSHNAMSALADGAILTINAGQPTFDASYGSQNNVTSGSYFGMDLSGDSKVQGTEKIILSKGTNLGIIIGAETTAGASHTGKIQAVDTNELNAPWEFAGNTGSGQFVPGSGGPIDNNNGTINWSGFLINWNGTIIDMGGGVAWQPLNCNIIGCTGITFTTGVANFSWNGVFGDPYVLQYTAVVPTGSFTGTQYYLRYEGTVLPPPNNPPVANNFTVNQLAGAASLVNVATNATDPDGNLDSTSVVINNDNSCAPGITNNNDGTVTLPNCPASTYTFDYTISDDGNGGPILSDSAQASVIVSADPPVNTSPDTANTVGETPVTIDVLSNDSGGGTADPITVMASMPSNGSATPQANGDIVYTANASFSGVDTFTYTVDTVTAVPSTPATVTINVSAQNVPSSDATFTPGSTATSAGSTTGIITAADIGVPDDGGSTDVAIAQSCIGGCFDFVLTNLAGTEATVVLPLGTPIPTVPAGDTLSYRKLIGGTWQNFDVSGNNAIHTAAALSGVGVVCPSATDPIYNTSSGLTPGHQCLRLTITDDGPNDNDPATGTIADPSGIAQTTSVDLRKSGTGGCSMTSTDSSLKDHAEWILIAGFLTLLGLFRRKPKQM